MSTGEKGESAMIRVEGPNPAALPSRTHHHGRSWLPLLNSLALSLLFESEFARDRREHVIKQSRPGANSFSLRTASGRAYHFRGTDAGIEVRDAYTQGNVLATITAVDDARRFFRDAGQAET